MKDQVHKVGSTQWQETFVPPLELDEVDAGDMVDVLLQAKRAGAIAMGFFNLGCYLVYAALREKH